VSRTVVNGEMLLRRLKLSTYEVVKPREEEKNNPENTLESKMTDKNVYNIIHLMHNGIVQEST
jgi:hypothetical protein